MADMYRSAYRTCPITVKRATALAFVERVHRRLPKVQGAMWGVGLLHEGELVGVVLVGWPSRVQTKPDVPHLRVLRCAVKEGHKNACSRLCASAWRAARALGALRMDTHTHGDESGVSLRPAGWTFGGWTAGGEHSRESRPRKAAVDATPKRRWWAPGSRWDDGASVTATPWDGAQDG